MAGQKECRKKRLQFATVKRELIAVVDAIATWYQHKKGAYEIDQYQMSEQIVGLVDSIESSQFDKCYEKCKIKHKIGH